MVTHYTAHHYTNLTAVRASVCTSGKVTGSYLTRVKNIAIFASVIFHVTEAADQNS